MDNHRHNADPQKKDKACDISHLYIENMNQNSKLEEYMAQLGDDKALKSAQEALHMRHQDISLNSIVFQMKEIDTLDSGIQTEPQYLQTINKAISRLITSQQDAKREKRKDRKAEALLGSLLSLVKEGIYMQLEQLEYQDQVSQSICSQLQAIEEWIKEKMEPACLLLLAKQSLSKNELRKELERLAQIDCEFSHLLSIIKFKKYQYGTVFPDLTNPSFKQVKDKIKDARNACRNKHVVSTCTLLYCEYLFAKYDMLADPNRRGKCLAKAQSHLEDQLKYAYRDYRLWDMLAALYEILAEQTVDPESGLALPEQELTARRDMYTQKAAFCASKVLRTRHKMSGSSTLNFIQRILRVLKMEIIS